MSSKIEKRSDEAGIDANFVAEAAAVAERIRYAASEVDRHGSHVRRNLTDLELDHADSAQEIVRDVQRLLGNLDLAALLRAATNADRKIRRAAVGDDPE